MTADAWGVEDGYHDIDGRWVPTDPAKARALRAAMGDSGEDPTPPPGRDVWIVHAGASPELEGPVDIRLEDGTDLRATERLPPDLPIGYHDLRALADGRTRRVADRRPTRVIVAPDRCHLPDDLDVWGLAAQLYAARSSRSWGMGDLGDLRHLADWSHRRGARVLGVNPLHAATPTLPQQPSPYYPSSRRWRNPLYLRIEDVPGAADEPELEPLAAAGRALNARDRIDRDAIWRLKRDALARLWRRFPGDRHFDAYRAEHGPSLQGFATFGALAEHHGSGWRTWPEQLRHPDRPAVIDFAREREDDVGFHAWLQWLLHEQLVAADPHGMLLNDIAVGIDPDGADGWQWQDLLALDVRIGAPPDEFNTLGQDWGLPPFVPWRLRDDGYDAFARVVRSGLRHGLGARIDHVMGLFRLYWIPPGAGPDAGAYVRYRPDELLAVVALESVRAGGIVVGEDLGTVEHGVRETLRDAGLLSYQLLWFEPEPPERYARQALAAVTTHDLPTIAGLWDGTDLEAQRRLELAPNEASVAEQRERLRTLIGAADDAPVDEVIVATHRRLAEAPSMVVTATLDDLLVAEPRPNMPGTTDQWPNWSIPLPAPIDDLDAQPLVGPVVDALADRRRVGDAAT